MDTDFEIAIFEYSDLYDGSSRVPKDQVVNQFIKHYIRYLSPEYYTEEDVWFAQGRLWFSCRDKTGGDKPMTIMLIGPITDEIVMEIKEVISKLYIKICPDCKKEMSKKESRKWAVCGVCREL
jgi:hypothetical protein